MAQVQHWFYSNGVDYILYFILIIVTLGTVKTFIEGSVKTKMNEMQHRYRLRKIRANKKIKERNYNHPFFKYIFFIIKTTSKEQKENDIVSFLVVTGCLFVFTGVFTYLGFKDIVLALILGSLVGLIPYMVLQIRLRSLRFALGAEFLNVIQILSQNYNACQYDIYHTLIETQKEVKQKALKQVFIRLISDLQVSRNEQAIRLSIEMFIFTVGSSWAKRLGNIILKAYLYDEKVMKTLLTLVRQMQETQEMLEEEQSQTMDSIWNGYLTVPVFIGSLVLGYYASGPQDWWNLQFVQFWPRLVFVIALIMVVFSIFISLILRRPKNDI